MRRLIYGILILLAGTASTYAQVRSALLIGINTYQPPQTTAKHPDGCSGGRCDLPAFGNLDGALNDVLAMRDLLVSPKFGFAVRGVTVLTNPALPVSQLPFVQLPAAQTTHDGILAAMQKHLVDLPNRGDTVVFYYAGHGSLRLNSKGNKLSLMVNGKQIHADSTLVPADAWTGGYDVRDREITRIFNAALDKGVKLTVILDSCHSGAFTRGIPLGPKAKERLLPYDPRDINEDPDGANGQAKMAPAERADNPALIFSAAQQDQTAKESVITDSVHEAHGAFTTALIKALEVLPADAPATVVYQQVQAELEGTGIEDQTPSLDAGAQRRQQPVFGGAAIQAGKLRAAVVSIDDDGGLTLDAGRLVGIGPGSTFVSFGVDDPSKKITLKVTDLEGIARSKATVATPLKAKVKVGEVFELQNWTPAPTEALHFWTWPSALPQTEIQAAVEQVRASGITIASDPAEEQWTHMLSWNGSNWILQKSGESNGFELGAKPLAAVLKQQVPSGSKVWVNLPPSQELAAKLNLHEQDSMVQGVADVASAEYVLAGSLTGNGPAWAWYHKAEFQMGPPDPHAPHHSPGCSSTSNFPVRTDWVSIQDAETLPDGASKLNDYATRLAKLAGWLRLPSSPGTGDDFYHLGFMRVTDSTLLPTGQAAQQGDRLKLVLTSSWRILEKRWVYILDIDCHGDGNLLYPLNYSENRFPNDANDQRQIVLPGGPVLKVGAPFGLDTILLVSTAEPLSDPYSLSFKGVGTRGGVSQPRSPLERLLSSTSSGTRGLDAQEVPTNWSVSISGLQSVPAQAP